MQDFGGRVLHVHIVFLGYRVSLYFLFSPAGCFIPSCFGQFLAPCVYSLSHSAMKTDIFSTRFMIDQGTTLLIGYLWFVKSPPTCGSHFVMLCPGRNLDMHGCTETYHGF